MCIAILKPSDKILDKDLLQACADNNPDGCGFAYNDNGKLIIKKFMDFNSFWKEYEKVQDNRTMLIHFRIATHGKVELANCHPFKLNNRMALVHNGIISGYGSKTDNVSDTKDFISKVIGNISHKMWKNPSFRTLVGASIGYSKFAILDIDDNYYIINESKGTWKDGVWFSNTSYEKRKQYVSATPSPIKTKNSWSYIMKCPRCNKEYNTVYWYEDVCKECHSQLEVIGFYYDGKKHYYNEKQKKLYNTKKNSYDYYDYGYYGY